MRENINDLLAFVAVATDKSFTQAAARLGISQSSLSRTIRRLEEQIGVRLLTRTTRSVSPTEAGQRLLPASGHGSMRSKPNWSPRRLARLDPPGRCASPPASMRRKPCSGRSSRRRCGTIPRSRWRSSARMALSTLRREGWMRACGLAKASRKDMIAVRIGPDGRLIPVASPAYLNSPCRTDDAAGPCRA